MKTILVPTDFSAAARNASEYAARLAQSTGAGIYLLNVYMEPMPVTVGPEPWSQTIGQLREEDEKNINREIERLKKEYKLTVNGSVETGFKGNTINETLEAVGADLVVMGSKAADKNFPGSTATRVLRKSSHPLLIVPEKSSFANVKNMVLAIDFNEMVSSSDLSVFFQLVKAFNASVRVLHIVKKGADLKASEISAKVQMGVVLSKITYTYDQVEYNNVDEGILNFANNHPTDMLVMIAHHHSLLERLFNPVHTKAISSVTGCPLLVLKTKRTAE